MLRAVLENGGPAGAGAKRGLFYTNCFEPLRAVPVLSTSARRVLTTENAGGSSEFSEALSFEVLHRAYNAKLVATEMEIAYYPLGSKRTDYVVEILGSTLGVSVSRAMAHRGVFTPSDARALLWKKLSGVQASTANGPPRPSPPPLRHPLRSPRRRGRQCCLGASSRGSYCTFGPPRCASPASCGACTARTPP